MSNEENLRIAEKETETNLTQEQKDSGDYKKGTVEINGFEIVIENPTGSIRSGVDKEGKSWSCEMVFPYGYINNTIGSDGDELDIFVGNYLDEDFDVYLVHQQDPKTQKFDEHKIMFGFKNIDDAISAYFGSYSEGWDGMQSIKRMSLKDFKSWVNIRNTIKNSSNKAKSKALKNVFDFAEMRTKTIKLEGEVIEKETLVDLQKQAGNLDDFDTLILEIASNGGSVCEGLYIMMWLNSLSADGKKVVTIVTANAYSIASLIMLAANLRVISSSADIMVHNPMLPEISFANAEELEAHAKGLRDLEAQMYELYEVFTGLETDVIKGLMDAETYLDADMAIKYNFADEKAELEKRPKAVGVNKQKITKMSKTKNALNKIIGMVQGSPIVNQLYYDDKGGDVEIFQKDPSTYAIGDRTSLESGVIKLSDGAVVTIVDFVITDIDRSGVTPANEAAPATTAPNVAPAPTEETPEAKAKAQAEKDAAEAKIKAEATPPVVDPAKEDPAAKAKAIEEEEMAQAKERIAKRVAELPKEDPAVVSPSPAEPPVSDPAKAIEDDSLYVTKEEFQALSIVVDKLKEELAGLKGTTETQAKAIDEAKESEELMVKAIDAIASSTVSGFKPDARAKVPTAPTGSIFDQMKKKVAAIKQ